MDKVDIKQEEDGIRGKFTIYEEDSKAGEMTYVWAGEHKFIIDHTETFEGYSGKGYGLKLVMEGMKYARTKDVKIIPLCPYVKAVMERDEKLHDLIYHS